MTKMANINESVIIIPTHDTTDPSIIEKESTELRELIKQIRTEANLLPMFKAKRRFSVIASTEEESSNAKQIRLSDEPETNINDRIELMSRLSSYSVVFQHTPRPVSALECAKHGWRDTKSVVDKDPNICVLTCDDCKNNMFVIDVDLKTCNQQKATDIEKKYKAGLFDCHKEDCKWRHKKCEDNMYRFLLSTISEGLERFETEAKNLILACRENKQSLPKIKHTLDDKTLLKVQYFSNHAKDQTTTSNNEKDNLETAYLLSLYGWKSLDRSVPGVQCNLCFVKKAFYQLKEDELFNVLDEHKSYCPWKNADTADTFTPKGYSSDRNRKISGSSWLKDIVCLEYHMQIRKQDLTLCSKQSADEKLYNFRQKMYESYDLLKGWKSSVEKLE